MISLQLAIMPLLAQGEASSADLLRTFMPLILIVFFGYFLLWMPEKKKRDETRQMLENLKENDRVVTAGGIHGVVTNIRRDNDMVTVRVDESTGAKIRLGKSAILQVVTDAAEKESQ